jgi:hypothetical protein
MTEHEPLVTVETITPELAAEWLIGNTHNRTLKNEAITKYATDMAAGRWDLNGESFKFNGDGRLLDGQNRLQAVIMSGSSIRAVVVRGIAAEYQETIDVGVPRKLSDVLKLRGEVNVIDLASGITRLWAFEKDPEESSFNKSPTIHQALAFLESHSGLRQSVAPAEAARKAVGLRGSVGIAMHYITTSLDAEDAEAFWLRLTYGVELSADDPILLLRTALLADRTGSQRKPRMTRAREWAITAKAWNAFREGRKLKLLRWSPGGAHPEAFPVPV